MDKAKAAVTGFLSKDGKHDTQVHETVNPAVQDEHITPTIHEDVQQAVDREVHQDHYHTSVQPIQQKEVLPEQHSHILAAAEDRHVKHGNDDHIKQKLAVEQAQFKNTSEVGATKSSSSIAPTVAGEHVHHRKFFPTKSFRQVLIASVDVHETIQPVIQKETIQPSVVHTTVPIHEVHHNEAKHHAASQLPPVTMSEFQGNGGSITNREEHVDAFAGEPKTVGNTLGGRGAAGTTSCMWELSIVF